jgi:hypothetical protein
MRRINTTGYDLLIVRGTEFSVKPGDEKEKSNEGSILSPPNRTKKSCHMKTEENAINSFSSKAVTKRMAPKAGTQFEDSIKPTKHKVWTKPLWTCGVLSHSAAKTYEIDDENKRMVARLLAATPKTSSVNAAKEHDLVSELQQIIDQVKIKGPFRMFVDIKQEPVLRCSICQMSRQLPLRERKWKKRPWMQKTLSSTRGFRRSIRQVM